MHFQKKIYVSGREISGSAPAYLIGEAGVNHGGDMDLARKLVDLGAAAGVDAIKFQSFKTEHLIIQNVKKAEYQTKTTDAKESQFEMLKKLEITLEQTSMLRDYCTSKGVTFLTTPFDEYSLDLLDELDLPAYKVASTDITNVAFLRRLAQKGKPIFLSTGMAFLSEVRLALETIYPHNQQVVLMQCTANYPIQNNEANLNVIGTYKDNFDVLVGYSDHTMGTGAAPYSVAAGAVLVEKHFTIDKTMPGPDHRASLDPKELGEFVKEVRRVEQFMGSHLKRPTISELGTRSSLQKCLVATQAIRKGEAFSPENIIGKRTGGEGLPASYIDTVIGQEAHRAFAADEIISLA